MVLPLRTFEFVKLYVPELVCGAYLWMTPLVPPASIQLAMIGVPAAPVWPSTVPVVTWQVMMSLSWVGVSDAGACEPANLTQSTAPMA